MANKTVNKTVNKFFISSTTIIASLILLVILFIIAYNSIIFPMMHQDKLQLTQDLFNSYNDNIKTNIDSEIVLNYNKYLINISIISINNDNNDSNYKLNIKFYNRNKIIYEESFSIGKENIKYSDGDSKSNIDINYNDILKINYNYIFNRYIILIKTDKFEFEGRFKIKCSNSPFISNTSKYKIIRKLLADEYTYDNVFGSNEYSKLIFNKQIKRFKNGSIFNFINNPFIHEYLLINIINDNWILFFIVNKINEKKYSCYMVIKNQINEQILYCGYLNKTLKFFHSVNIELNIGSNINEFKFKFYSENILIDFNTNNIVNNLINENKIFTSIDLNIFNNNEVYKSSDNLFLFSNKPLSQYNNLLLKI